MNELFSPLLRLLWRHHHKEALFANSEGGDGKNGMSKKHQALGAEGKAFDRVMREYDGSIVLLTCCQERRGTAV